MRSVAAVALLVSIVAASDACPWQRRCCRPVYYYPPCPTPVVAAEVKPPEPVAKEDVAPDGWCHIRGRIVFDGNPIPEQKEIPRSGGAYTEDWVVNANNRGVANVVVWLAPEPSAAQMARLKSTGADRLREFPNFAADVVYPTYPKRKDEFVVVPQKPRAFYPHIVALRAGSDVVFRNTAQVPENIKWDSRNNGLANRLLAPINDEIRMAQVAPERFPIAVSSSISPWMTAYIRVFDHPYFAITNEDGEFTIRFAPKGSLRLFVWQETAGFRNGAEGRFGEPIEAPSGQLKLGEIKIKP